MSGSDTKTVASTIAGVSNITRNPASSSMGPNQPVRGLYTSISARPTTIGETDNGRSMKAFSRRLPGNS